jgi:nondiscriminating glutamyl-tRNA synthetase
MEPYRQTESSKIYQKAADTLKIWLCLLLLTVPKRCEAERQELLEKGETPVLRKCRNLTEEQKRKFEQEGRKPSSVPSTRQSYDYDS